MWHRQAGVAGLAAAGVISGMWPCGLQGLGGMLCCLRVVAGLCCA
jgi:hypothetical protein